MMLVIQALKDSLVMSLSLMPPEALVAVITYGAHVCACCENDSTMT